MAAPGYGLLGILQGFNQRNQQIHDQDISDAQHAAELSHEKQMDVQSKEEADRQAALFPGQLDEQSAHLGLEDAQLAQTKQATAQGAQTFTQEQQLRNYQILQQKLQLNDEDMSRLHNAAFGASKLLAQEFANYSKDPNALDPAQVETAYNEAAPASQQMQKGSLKITPNTQDPSQSTIQYTRADGTPVSVTYGNFAAYATAFAPPVKGEVVNNDQRVVNPVTGATITPAASPTALGKTDPTAWTGQAAKQIAQGYGGTFDENGNLKMLDPNLAAKVSKVSGIATQVGQATGYGIPAPTVAAAVQQAYDERSKAAGAAYNPDTDAGLMPRIQQLLGPTGSAGGINGAPSPAPTTGGGINQPPPDAPTDPTARTTGTVYNTPKGPLQWTGTGWLPPSP